MSALVSVKHAAMRHSSRPLEKDQTSGNLDPIATVAVSVVIAPEFLGAYVGRMLFVSLSKRSLAPFPIWLPAQGREIAEDPRLHGTDYF